MKKFVAILLGCMLVAGVSANAQAKKSSKSSAKKTTKTVKKASKQVVDIKKGTYFVNANLTNIGFNALKIGPSGGKSSVTRFGFQGNGGYAIEDNLAITGGIGFQYAKLEDTKIMAIDLTAGVRYYFVPKWFCAANLGFAHMKVSGVGSAAGMAGGLTGDDDDQGGGGMPGNLGDSVKGHNLSLGLGVGYSHWLSKKIAIEPSLGYSISLASKMAGQKVSMNGLSLNVGITVLL